MYLNCFKYRFCYHTFDFKKHQILAPTVTSFDCCSLKGQCKKYQLHPAVFLHCTEMDQYKKGRF